MNTDKAPKASNGLVSRRTVLLTVALVGAAAGAVALTPDVRDIGEVPDLGTAVPRTVGQWTELSNAFQQVALSTGDDPSFSNPYDQTVMKSYRNQHGDVLHLALAWGKKQRQEIKIHKPEFCYRAQGYEVEDQEQMQFNVNSPSSGKKVDGVRLRTTDRNGVTELVSYWIRIGKIYSPGTFATRFHILEQGLEGHIPDGILVRVSQRGGQEADMQARYKAQEDFVLDLVAALPEEARALLLR